MKTIFTLMALGSFAFLSADSYDGRYGNGRNSCPTCNQGGGYYERDNGSYYQQNQYYQDDSQRDDRNYSRNNQYQQQSGYDQGYYQGRGNDQGYYQDRGNDQSYNQGRGNDQQRNYDNARGNDNKAVTDQDISKKIQDTLGSGWFSKGFQNVTYDVHSGNVNLRGTVDTQEDRNKVEDSVRKIAGVRQVNNQIAVAKKSSDGYSDDQVQNLEKKYPQDAASTSQDRHINAKIREKLNNGWFSKGFEALVIRTNNGVVVITGVVDKPEDVQKVSEQVKNVEGVKSVNNQLSVKSR